jgi:hypothetical protein
MYKLCVRINDLPKTRNALSDKRWTRYKESKKWHALVKLSIPPHNKPDAPLEKAKLHFIRCSSKMPDYDGLVSSFKYVLDALVQHKILVDDNLNVCKQPRYEWIKGKRNQGYIEIRVRSDVSRCEK